MRRQQHQTCQAKQLLWLIKAKWITWLDKWVKGIQFMWIQEFTSSCKDYFSKLKWLRKRLHLSSQNNLLLNMFNPNSCLHLAWTIRRCNKLDSQSISEKHYKCYKTTSITTSIIWLQSKQVYCLQKELYNTPMIVYQ